MQRLQKLKNKTGKTKFLKNEQKVWTDFLTNENIWMLNKHMKGC